MKTETTKHDKTIFFNRIPSIPVGRIPQLFLKMQLPKIKMGSTKMQTSWSKSVPFIVESLEQTNFDSSTITLADVEFLPTQQTSPKRAKVPLLLCALRVAYFIISCCDLNHLPPPSLSTDGNNYRLQHIFSGCKPVFFFLGGGGGCKLFLKMCKKGNIPFFVPGSLWSYFPDAIR